MSDTPAGGIERDYADLLPRLDSLIRMLQNYPVSNDTPEGRVRGIAEFARDEVLARRLPIPLDRSYWATLAHVVGSADLDHIEGSYGLLVQIMHLLDGEGLVDRSQYPAIAGRIRAFVSRFRAANGIPREAEARFAAELDRIAKALERGEDILPVSHARHQAEFPASGWMRPLRLDLSLGGEWIELSETLYGAKSNETGRPARYPAPVAGLLPVARTIDSPSP
jgi:hypothetical protein